MFSFQHSVVFISSHWPDRDKPGFVGRSSVALFPFTILPMAGLVLLVRRDVSSTSPRIGSVAQPDRSNACVVPGAPAKQQTNHEPDYLYHLHSSWPPQQGRLKGISPLLPRDWRLVGRFSRNEPSPILEP